MIICRECGLNIIKNPKESNRQYNKRIYCSNNCASKNRPRGQIAWNKNTSGIMKPNKTSYVKGDKRLLGKKQTEEHIYNAAKGRAKAKGLNIDNFVIKQSRLSKYRYFYSLQKKHNISEALYNQMLTDQKGTCAICKRADKRRLCVDHNHSTGEIRGLLCTKCNATLGQVNDNIEILTRMVRYLKK